MDRDLGLLWLRITIGFLMLLGHGLPKLLGFSDMSGGFPDPFNVGSTLSLTLAVFAEFFCSILIILGIKTRFAAIPLFITMLVAFLLIHAQDPWGRKEMAVLYGVVYGALIIMGGGKYSLDTLWTKGGRKRRW